MKIAFTTFACPDWNLRQVIEAAITIGYDGIEFRCDAGHGHGVEVKTPKGERDRIRSLLEGAGVAPCCLGTSLQFADESVADHVVECAQLAADIGCPGVRVFCGPPPEGTPMPQVIELVGQRLANAANLSDHTGVDLWLATHDTMSHAASAAAAVRRAAHNRVGILYDNLHPYRRGEPLDATVAALGNLTRHVHFHDGLCDPKKVIIKPFGQGELPIDEMFHALVNMGFDGHVCGEWFYDTYGDDPADALERYRKELIEVARRHNVVLGRPT